jgi:Type IV secretory pathway, TrbF components
MADGNLFDIFNGEDDNNVTRIDPPSQGRPGSNGHEQSSTHDRPSAEGDQDFEEDPTLNPFLERQQWLRNRLDRVNRQNLFLRFLAGVSIIAVVVAVAVNLWISSSSQVEPIYVPIDRSTQKVLEPQSADRIQTLSEPLIRQQLRDVVSGLRTVYADFRATKRSYQNAWNYIRPSSEAEVFLKDAYGISSAQEEVSSPPSLTGSIQRQISNLEIVPIEGSDSYSISWVEREARLDSETVVERAYTGSMSVVRIEQSDMEALRKNPTGLFVKGLSWQKTSSELLQSTDSGSQN